MSSRTARAIISEKVVPEELHMDAFDLHMDVYTCLSVSPHMSSCTYMNTHMHKEGKEGSVRNLQNLIISNDMG